MNPDDPSLDDDNFTTALEACDEALAQGRPADLSLSSVAPQMRRRLEEAAALLRRLERDRLASRPAAAPAGPERVGRFRIRRELGRGGFGVVYLAHDPATARDVALKVPRYEGLVTPELSRRFLREAHTAAGLDHPHLVPVYEAGADGLICYIASAYCPGGSLADWLRGRGTPMPWALAARVVAAVAGAVAYIHGRGILHRDLKPANVLLHGAGGDETPLEPGAWPPDLGRPRVCDFGLAKTLDDDTGDTRSVAILGTPAYMAPEQAAGRSRDVTPATDVYALGAILYECLTGRPPFTRERDPDILERIQHAPPVPPQRLRPDLPRDLEAVCLRCLEKDPARRFASAALLADELGRCLRGEPTLTRPCRWPGRAWRSLKRHPLPCAAILLVALLLAAVPLFRYARHPDRVAERIEAALSRGEKRTLIGDTGEPEWFRLRNGAGASRLSMGPDGTFSVHSWDLCLVELVRNPSRTRYRIRAQVRHKQSNAPGEVGLFFLLREQATPDGPVFSFGQLTFNDIDSAADQADKAPPHLRPLLVVPTENPVYLIPHLCPPGLYPVPRDWKLGGRSSRLFKPAGHLGGDWRTLTVEITPRGIRGEWADGVVVGEVPGEEWAKTVREGLRGPKAEAPSGEEAPPPGFSQGGGFGLYVVKGSASFRRVVVEPLAEEDERVSEDLSRADRWQD